MMDTCAHGTRGGRAKEWFDRDDAYPCRCPDGPRSTYHQYTDEGNADNAMAKNMLGLIYSCAAGSRPRATLPLTRHNKRGQRSKKGIATELQQDNLNMCLHSG